MVNGDRHAIVRSKQALACWVYIHPANSVRRLTARIAQHVCLSLDTLLTFRSDFSHGNERLWSATFELDGRALRIVLELVAVLPTSLTRESC